MGKTKGSLKKKILRITLIPLIVTGIAIMFTTYFTFTNTIQSEVERGLSNIAITTQRVYDRMYPGDYAVVEENGQYFLYKGKYNLSADDNYLQEIRRDTGIDVTFFYQDIRMLTTLKPINGVSLVGTKAHSNVIRDVLNNKKDTFYRSVLVGETECYGYYSPVYNGTGECVGMIFAGKPAAEVQAEIWKAILPAMFVILVMTACTCMTCVSFANESVMIITRIKSFLREIAQGNLKAGLDERIMKRDDELGEMGRFTSHVQYALREMIEKDMLTKLYSRRIGEIRMRQVQKDAAENGSEFCLVLADIDFFKKFNDTYGHDCGDLVLKEVADILINSMIGKGFAIRWGGEEILLVYENCNLKTAREHLERIKEKVLACEVHYNDEILHVTMTYGITPGVTDEPIEASVKAADDLLYEGKTSGRNRIVTARNNS